MTYIQRHAPSQRTWIPRRIPMKSSSSSEESWRSFLPIAEGKFPMFPIGNGSFNKKKGGFFPLLMRWVFRDEKAQNWVGDAEHRLMIHTQSMEIGNWKRNDQCLQGKFETNKQRTSSSLSGTTGRGPVPLDFCGFGGGGGMISDTSELPSLSSLSLSSLSRSWAVNCSLLSRLVESGKTSLVEILLKW